MDRPLVRPAEHVLLDPAVLIAQLDFQMEDVPRCTETEMSRLDDPCVPA
jgi:hypothetical protein